MQVSDNHKIKNRNGKWLMRRLLADYFPPAYFNRQKLGFRIPLKQWFRRELKDMLLDQVNTDSINHLGYLNPDLIIKIRDNHLNEKIDASMFLWNILSLMNWHDMVKSRAG